MFVRLLHTIRRLWERWVDNPFQSVNLEHIDEEDLCYDPDVERILKSLELQSAFRCFRTLEDYNKDFIAYFKSHRREFLLDYSQKDGHFRV